MKTAALVLLGYTIFSMSALTADIVPLGSYKLTITDTALAKAEIDGQVVMDGLAPVPEQFSSNGESFHFGIYISPTFITFAAKNEAILTKQFGMQSTDAEGTWSWVCEKGLFAFDLTQVRVLLLCHVDTEPWDQFSMQVNISNIEQTDHPHQFTANISFELEGEAGGFKASYPVNLEKTDSAGE